MALTTQYRSPPRLGTIYAIFVSGFVSLVLLLLILEQLGARKLWLSHIIVAAPLLTYLGIALVTRTVDAQEFFAAGRRVPPLFNGLALAASTLGGIGLFALTGLFYLIGFDAFSIAIGWCGGLLVSAVLIAPYLRKAGAYNVAGFLRLRFASPLLGAIAALLIIPSAIIVLAAELRLGAFISSLFAAVPFDTALIVAAVLVAASAALGGLRSLTWTQCSQYAVMLVGYMAPLVIVALLLTKLPLPQFSYGAQFSRLRAQEIAVGIQLRGNAGTTLDTALPTEALTAATTAFQQPFASLAASDFVMLLLCFLAGSLVMPALSMRAGTASNVFETRRGVAWGLLFIGVFLLSAPAYAVFTKLSVLHDLVGTAPSRLPDWVGHLRGAGLADFSDRNRDGVIGATELRVSRDGLALALPIMADFPFILVTLVAAAGISGTLAAASAQVAAIGAAISSDIMHSLNPSASPGRRLLVARLAIVAATAFATAYVAREDFDILRAACYAMSLSASAFLPALVLAIWWRRTTSWGALAGALLGFAVAAAYIWAATRGITVFGVSGLLAAVWAVPAGFMAAVGVSLLTPRPLPAQIDLLDEIRDPSGVAIQDRPPKRTPRPAPTQP